MGLEQKQQFLHALEDLWEGESIAIIFSTMGLDSSLGF
jgi:hypothetical protein